MFSFPFNCVNLITKYVGLDLVKLNFTGDLWSSHIWIFVSIFIFVCVCVFVFVCGHQGAWTVVRRQLLGVSSLLWPCGSQGSNSDIQFSNRYFYPLSHSPLPYSAFYVGAGDLHSGPRVCKASTLAYSSNPSDIIYLNMLSATSAFSDPLNSNNAPLAWFQNSCKIHHSLPFSSSHVFSNSLPLSSPIISSVCYWCFILKENFWEAPPSTAGER